MKLVSFALAAALAVSASTFANAATPPNTTGVVQHTSDPSTAWNAWVAAWTPVFTNVFGAGNFEIENTGILSGRSFASQIVSTVNVPGTSNDYAQLFYYSASRGTVSYNSPVAVPGPEAGAGLGAALLGGMYLWRRRQQERQSA